MHFHQTKEHNVEYARKAMHVLFKRIRNLNIPNDLQLYLFDHVILPVALYGALKVAKLMKIRPKLRRRHHMLRSCMDRQCLAHISEYVKSPLSPLNPHHNSATPGRPA